MLVWFVWLVCTWLGSNFSEWSLASLLPQCAHDLAQSPSVIAFQNLTWLSLCRLSPGAWFGLFGWVYMARVRLCRLGPSVITSQVVHDFASAFADWALRHYFPLCYTHYPGGLCSYRWCRVVVDVDVDCGRCRKTCCLGPQISRVVSPQKYNQLIWLSSRQLILYTCDEMTVEQTRYGKLPSNPCSPKFVKVVFI